MQARRRQLLARLILGAAVAASVAWLATLDYEQHISTDVLDLMPMDERQPDLALVRSMASQQQARVALFVLERRDGSNGDAGAGAPLAGRRDASRPDEPTTPTSHGDPDPLASATDAFVAALRGSPAFAEVIALDDPELREEIARFVFARRFELLFPDWLAARAAQSEGEDDFAAWLAERTAAELDAFLQRPDAPGFDAVLPADPLLLIPRLTEAVQGLPGSDAAANDQARALVWARTTASPLTEDGQQAVFAAVDDALGAARTIAADTELRWTAVSRFAAESRRRIQTELSVLNTLALLAVATVAALCLHRIWQLLHLVPGIVCALLGAWSVTTLIYDRVHVLVFVIGSLLGGIASDYGLHVYLHPGRPGEDFGERLRAVRRPLIGSAITAMIGFGALLLSELPLIRQVGVFVLAGLVAAMASALLWFAQVREPQGKLRPRIQHGLFPPRWLAPARRVVLVVGCVVIAGGIWRVRWRDDIRELEVRAPELWDNDRAVRHEFGEAPDRRTFLVRGASPADARAALAEFSRWMQREHPDATLASAGFVLPSPAAWEALPAQLERLDDFGRELRAALERHDFAAAEFAPFFDAWEEFRKSKSRPAFAELVRDFTATMQGPAGMLFSTEPDASWFAVAIDGTTPRAPPQEISVVDASQLQSLNHLFGSYRRSALRLSLIGLAAASASVLLVYGIRRGPRMLLIPLGACAGAFGALGLAGQALNLFHLLGAFLALCLCFDYAIFTGDRAARGERGAPPSVRLSALNTMASFGVLAFSRIPVVAALGTTVALIAIFALVMVELDFFGRARD